MAVLSLFVPVVLAACGGGAPPPEPRPGASLSAWELAPPLEPGDAIKVEVWREVDASGTFTVDERGSVTFPLLGERQVAGVPADSLRDRLLADYGRYLRNPSVRITFLRRINILGEVRSPGLYPVDGTVTLADALALAGGVAPSGNPNDIRLIRDGRVIRRDLSQTTVIDRSPIRSGDQIMVGQRSWVSRNVPIVTSMIGAVSAFTVALILR